MNYSSSSMTGEDGRFQPTRWTHIIALSTLDTQKHQKLLGELLSQYWKPIYCYIRRKGNPRNTAEDLTQSFISEVIIGRELIAQADKSKGRFRTFIRRALENFLHDAHDKKNAQKRSPQSPQIPIDISDIPDDIMDTGQTPEEIFNYALASEILSEVIADLENVYSTDGKKVYWDIFEEKVLTPLLDGSEPPSNAAMCSKYHFHNEAAVSNMIVTVKRRFKTLMRNHLRDLVQSDSDVDDELNEIFKILSR